MAENVMTPKFRTSFVNVFRPSANKNDPTAEPKYSLTMLFAKDADLSALKKAAQAAIVEKLGPDQSKWPKNLKNPFRDQGDFEYDGYEKGSIFIRASSKQKPGLVDQKNQDILEEKDFYSGCYARATVRAFYYDTKGNRGVSFGLQNVQKLGEGDPLGGRTRASQDFEPVADANEPAAAGVGGIFD